MCDSYRDCDGGEDGANRGTPGTCIIPYRDLSGFLGVREAIYVIRALFAGILGV